MASESNSSFTPRYDSAVLDERGLLSRVWQTFMRKVSQALSFLGDEYNFDLVNNTAVAASITNLSFDRYYTSQAVVDYVIQRWTTSTGLFESGCFHAVYQPDTDDWALVSIGTAGPDASGITLTITAAGQIQYTSTNIAGTQNISRIVFRVREIAAKSSLYSKVG
jgi:hypothetical protein